MAPATAVAPNAKTTIRIRANRRPAAARGPGPPERADSRGEEDQQFLVAVVPLPRPEQVSQEGNPMETRNPAPVL